MSAILTPGPEGKLIKKSLSLFIAFFDHLAKAQQHRHLAAVHSLLIICRLTWARHEESRRVTTKLGNCTLQLPRELKPRAQSLEVDLHTGSCSYFCSSNATPSQKERWESLQQWSSSPGRYPTTDGSQQRPRRLNAYLYRHGARIDAVDKAWHLTSPTPYDPPLTYGGWTQGRALGARIASLLQAREESVLDHHTQLSSSSNGAENGTIEAAHSGQDTPTHHVTTTRVRKHKVIIHSSPFLRCVQTAIAISAGMSQYHRTCRNSIVKPVSDASPSPESVQAEVSPKSTPVVLPEDDVVPLAEEKKGNNKPASQRAVPKTRLRIDAFLGEWLSPEYFQDITPPPSSVTMVAGAKSELLRRGEGIHRTHDMGSKSISGHFPGGWQSNSNPTSPAQDDDEGRFRNMAAMAHSLAKHGRPGSHDGQVGLATRTPTIRDVLSRRAAISHEDSREGYIPPSPSYAISSSDPIPAGYVAHARDACVDVDYQWDSMREPHNWGSGGEYGEEWSAMHLRFRNGLQSMIDWYRKHDRPHPHNHKEDSDEDFTDLVLILVTHGAGCNALIGALTGQPVLLDVPMASLTMAVRKDIIEGKDAAQYIAEKKEQQQEEQRRRSSLDLSISQEYDVSLIASIEHLRAEPDQPLSIPQLPAPTVQRSPSII